jgi:hypothetical protein
MPKPISPLDVFFAQIPDVVLADKTLSPCDRLVYAGLSSFFRKDRRTADAITIWPSNRSLAIASGTSLRTVMDSLATLEKRGLITRETRFRKGRQTSSETTLNAPSSVYSPNDLPETSYSRKPAKNPAQCDKSRGADPATPGGADRAIPEVDVDVEVDNVNTSEATEKTTTSVGSLRSPTVTAPKPTPLAPSEPASATTPDAVCVQNSLPPSKAKAKATAKPPEHYIRYMNWYREMHVRFPAVVPAPQDGRGGAALYWQAMHEVNGGHPWSDYALLTRGVEEMARKKLTVPNMHALLYGVRLGKGLHSVIAMASLQGQKETAVDNGLPKIWAEGREHMARAPRGEGPG